MRWMLLCGIEEIRTRRGKTSVHMSAGGTFHVSAGPCHTTLGDAGDSSRRSPVLSSCVEQEHSAVITVVSLCVKGLVVDKFVAREKQGARYTAPTHVALDKKTLQLRLRCVRGHTGDGRLADCRTRPVVEKRPPE